MQKMKLIFVNFVKSIVFLFFLMIARPFIESCNFIPLQFICFGRSCYFIDLSLMYLAFNFVIFYFIYLINNCLCNIAVYCGCFYKCFDTPKHQLCFIGIFENKHDSRLDISNPFLYGCKTLSLLI